MSRDGNSGGSEGLRTLTEGAARLGVPLDARQLDQFARLRDLLLDWNTRVNLTAITDPAEVLTKHFLDSLTCVLALPSEARATPHSALDVGAGAGFPGLPLAIALPAWHVTLLEATGKKVRFIAAAIDDLGLPNATAITCRAEELAHQPAYRSAYDFVTARAVAALPTLLEFCCPFAEVGATLIFPKKGELIAELAAGERAAAILGAELLPPVPVPPLVGLSNDRVLIAARQRHPCPSEYPRAAGAPVKRPLGGAAGG